MAHLRPRYRYTGKKGSDNRTKTLTGYAAEFYDPTRHPKRKYVTLRTKDKQAARHKLAEMEREYMAGLYDPWTDNAKRAGVLYQEAKKAYVKACRRKDFRPNTVKRYKSVLRQFEKHVPPGEQLVQIEGRHIRAYVYRDTLAQGTKDAYFRALKTFFRWCVKEGMLKHNPIDDVEQPKLGEKMPAYITRRQYQALLRTIEADEVLKARWLGANGLEWLKDAIKVATCTGMRAAEITHMRWDQVDLDGQTLHIRNWEEDGIVFRTKNGCERSIPIEGDALEVLQRRHAARTSEANDFVIPGRHGGQLCKVYLSVRFKHYATETGLPDYICLHSLRHTYGSWLAEAGTDAFRIMQLMGHQDISVTMNYMHLAPDAARKDVQRTFGRMGLSRVAA